MSKTVAIKQGEWVQAQELGCSDRSLWFRVLVLGDQEGVLVEETSDGWCFVECVATQLRYKCWNSSLKKG
jgi:hypothetical protein